MKLFKKNTILVFAVVLLLFGCKKTTKDVFLKIENENISIAEFNVYLYFSKQGYEEDGGKDIWDAEINGVPVTEIAKQAGLRTITAVKLSKKYAKEQNLQLQNTQGIKLEAEAFFNSLSDKEKELIGADFDLIFKVYEELAIYYMVFDELTENFVTSEADFADFYNLEKNKYVTLNIFYVLFSTESVAKEFYDLLFEYDDINAALALLTSSPNSVKETIYKYGTNDKNFEDIIYNLSVAEHTIIESDEGFYVVKLLSRVFEEEATKHNLEVVYNEEKKDIIFNEMIEIWKAQANIELISENWDNANVIVE